MSSLVPSSELKSSDVSTWSHRVGVMFETRFADDQAFSISLRNSHLGGMIVSEMRTSPFHFARSPAKLRSDMLDHFMLRLDLVGQQSRLNLIDFGQALDYAPLATHNICIILPRRTVTDAVGRAEYLHGAALGGPGVDLLKGYVQLLNQQAPYLQTAQADGAARALIDLMAGTLSGTHQGQERGRAAVTLAATQRAQAYINARLGDPGLRPGQIARDLGLSRSALYRLFEPLGGVASVVLERRLERAYRLLSDPRETRQVSTIAHALGFGSESHFARAFRQRFGHRPSDVRMGARATSAGSGAQLAPALADRPFAAWLNGL